MAPPLVVAVEIGTSKTVALVGEMREGRHIRIAGVGLEPSRGLRKGEVIDIEAATAGVRKAVEQAEQSGRMSAFEAHLVYSGSDALGLLSTGTAPVQGPAQGVERLVTAEDVEQVRQIACALSLPPDRRVLHSLSRFFQVDDQEQVLRPEGMPGARLSHEVLMVHVSRTRLDNALAVLRNAQLRACDVVFGGLCSATAVLSAQGQDRLNGVLVADMGGGKTDYVAFDRNVICAAGSLGVGGDHLTNDIAAAFNLSIAAAEQLKRKHAHAAPEAPRRGLRVTLPPEIGFPGRSVSLAALHDVTRARMQEWFEVLRSRLAESGALPRLNAGVVLTGGAACLPGAADLAGRVFNLPCRIGMPQDMAASATVCDGPEYAACAGLVRYAFKEYTDRRRARGGMMGRLMDWMER